MSLPARSLADPVANQVDLRGSERLAGRRRRHLLVRVGRADPLKKLAGSNYARTDVRALAHAKPGGHESSGTDDIRRFIRGWKHFSTAQLKDLFREHGRNPHSVSPILDKMAKQKLIKRTGPSGSGEYMPLAKAKKIAPKKALKALNGAQPVIEANANG